MVKDLNFVSILAGRRKKAKMQTPGAFKNVAL